jgi:hypothetical protein
MTQDEIQRVQEIHAWTFTYGKGINPEGVEKMKAVLEHLLTLEAFKKRFPFLATLSEEALTSAKL